MNIPVVENVLKINDQLAALNRRRLGQASICAINLIGAPGCGKTALLEATLRLLSADFRCAVLAGDLATQRDADRLAKYCPRVVQINTGKGCHLEAGHVAQALEQLNLADIDLLFIENVGNLICPVGFDVGQNYKVGIFSTTEGDDKPAKHPYIVMEADLLLLNKIDLLEHVPFDRELFEHDIRRLKPDSRLLALSARTLAGIEPWIEQVRQWKNAAPGKQ